MAVLIDPSMWPAHGTVWSHLVSDTSLEELHAFARANDVPRRSFDLDHYDVPEHRVAELVAAGAQPVSGHELVSRLIASGLRVRARDR
ncbi:DUF4031 domain-containing protein [Naasia sp. SYSU D00057]|uniref:DUF4031 domain-containing protein n=1 Tax=Naasia sp. SYSU D00057 TaxID=2817380 RepID=UPI001B3132FE|nr:DUF4031 domain-containing protein [Naasia sp. SYSU D00057]